MSGRQESFGLCRQELCDQTLTCNEIRVAGLLLLACKDNTRPGATFVDTPTQKHHYAVDMKHWSAFAAFSIVQSKKVAKQKW